MKCVYCRPSPRMEIYGQSLRTDDFKHTSGYTPNYEENSVLGIKFDRNYLDVFILKGKKDKKAGLLINTGQGYGYRYVDINYCPFCGRFLNEIQNER